MEDPQVALISVDDQVTSVSVENELDVQSSISPGKKIIVFYSYLTCKWVLSIRNTHTQRRETAHALNRSRTTISELWWTRGAEAIKSDLCRRQMTKNILYTARIGMLDHGMERSSIACNVVFRGFLCQSTVPEQNPQTWRDYWRLIGCL